MDDTTYETSHDGCQTSGQPPLRGYSCHTNTFETMTLGNIVYLEEHGLAPVAGLSHEITTLQRAEGLSCLTLYASRGPAERVSGHLSPIADLDAEHDPVAVVWALIEANPKLTEENPAVASDECSKTEASNGARLLSPSSMNTRIERARP